MDKLEASKSYNAWLLELSPPGAGTKVDVEMEPQSETSDSDTFEPGTGRVWDWIDLEERWNGLGSGFGAEQDLIGPGETDG